MATENSEDTRAQIKAIKQIIKNCILDKINTDNLPLFDLEYIFLHLRSKSVGEVVDLIYNCQKEGCEAKTDFQLDLSEVDIIRNEKHTNKIELTDSVGMIMKYPTIKTLNRFNLNDPNSTLDLNMDSLIGIIASCIESLYDEETVYDPKDSSKEELVDYISNFSQKQFELVQEFFDTSPKIQKKVTLTCSKCNNENEHVIEGISNFFG